MKNLTIIISLLVTIPLFSQERDFMLDFITAPNGIYLDNPTEPPDDIKSATPFVKAKKESIKESMERMVADGNAVGFLFEYRRAKDPNVENILYDTYDNQFITEIKNWYLTALSQATGIKIEEVDIKKIPLKTETLMGRSGDIFDWLSTKYKLLIHCPFNIYINHDIDIVANKKMNRLAVYGDCTVYDIIDKNGNNKVKWRSNIPRSGYYKDLGYEKGAYWNLPDAETVKSEYVAEAIKGIDKWAEKKLNK